MNSIKGTVAFCLIFIAAVLLMFYSSKTRMPQLTEDQMRQAGIYILPKPRELSDFELQDHTGAPFVRDDLKGGWSFLFSVLLLAQMYVPRLCQYWEKFAPH